MNRRRLSRLSALLLAMALPFALSACGNKGPLVLPDQQKTGTAVSDEAPAAEASVDTPAEVPTEAPATQSEPPPHRDR